MKEQTAQLLRPHQIESLNEDKRRIERTLQAPNFVQQQIQDPGSMRKQLRSIVQMLETQSPKPYSEHEKDHAIARRDELQEKFLRGIPTQEEMRRNPPGAVDKNRSWEAREKKHVLEWKNIQLRLMESGSIDGLRNSEDVANIEGLRPFGGAQQLNMMNEQIQGTEYHMDHTPKSVVMTDPEIQMLKDIDPELAEQLATMPAEMRKAVKGAVNEMMSKAPGNEESHVSVAPVCGGTAKDGSICQKTVINEGDKCRWHKE